MLICQWGKGLIVRNKHCSHQQTHSQTNRQLKARRYHMESCCGVFVTCEQILQLNLSFLLTSTILLTYSFPAPKKIQKIIEFRLFSR